MKITAKIRKRTNLVFKILVISLVYLFLFFELSKNNQNIWQEILLDTSNINPLYLWTAILLMPINWMIESIKWQFLIRKIEEVNLWTSFQAVLAGTAISIFTPNRIGDYLGRIFILKKGDRIDGTVATIVGNVSQLLITIIMGSMAIVYFIDDINQYTFQLPASYNSVFIILVFIIIIALLFIFFRFPKIEERLNRNFKIYRYPFIKHLNLLAEFKPRELLKVLLYSLMRFLVYSFQFYMLFLAFQLNIFFIEGMFIIFLIFFGITIIPSIAVAELGIRGIITIFIFNLIWSHEINLGQIETTLVSATSLLWLINLALPAIIGGLFIFKLRFLRKSDFNAINKSSSN